MRFFVIGKYSDGHPRDILKNVNKAIDIGIELMKKGHSVYIPHFTHYMHLRPNCPFEYEEYLKNDLEWLKVSDAVFFLSHSNGADGELEVVKKLGLKIYTDINEVGVVREEIKK